MIKLCEDNQKSKIIVPTILNAFSTINVAKQFIDTNMSESTQFNKAIFKISVDQTGTIL